MKSSVFTHFSQAEKQQVIDQLKKPAPLTKATNSKIRVRQTSPGLTRHDVEDAANAIVNKQLTDAIGEAGEALSLELAAALADVLDIYYQYTEMLDAAPLDLQAAHSYLDPRTWECTSNNVRNMLDQLMINARARMHKQAHQEIANLEAMMDAVEKTSPVAQERFERRRLERAGLEATTINERIAAMKSDGRL